MIFFFSSQYWCNGLIKCNSFIYHIFIYNCQSEITIKWYKKGNLFPLILIFISNTTGLLFGKMFFKEQCCLSICTLVIRGSMVQIYPLHVHMDMA